MNNVSVRTFFVGPQWATASFANDKITGIDSFFGGYSGSAYSTTANEYVGSNGEVGSSLAYEGHEIASSASSSVDGQSTYQVTNAVCAAAAGNSFLQVSGAQKIVVYTDKPRPRGANYCGYHGTTNCSFQQVQYAFLWAMDGDAGCSAQDSQTGHSQGRAALVNVTSHELAEARTDPQLSSWYDAQGAERTLQ